MSLSLVPVDLFDEIASHADQSTLLNLLYLSPAIQNSLRRFLYRHIEVGPTSDLLVATLAESAVRSLSLFPSGDCRVGGATWEKALSQMPNLMHLGVSKNVERPLGTLSFHLRSFAAYGSMMPSWVRFVNKHPQLVELRVYGRQHDVSGLMLPALHRLTGNANVIAHLALFRPVTEVGLLQYTPSSSTIAAEDLLMLKRVKPGTLKLRIKCCLLKAVAEIAPEFLLRVRDLILEDDSTYIRRQRNIPEKTSIYSCEHVLTEEYMPDLRSLHLISWYEAPTQDSVMWAMQRGPVHRRLENIHFSRLIQLTLPECWACAQSPPQDLPNSWSITIRTPETLMEEEWRQSMQGVADLAEEWAADVEEQWQQWAQKLEDCANELYAVKSTLLPGSDEYWHAKRLVGIYDGEGVERHWASANIGAGA
ncbi:hypothetical protein C8J57DRAFT_1516284 [Mycena rebaudengoi]|nr:hypothetical protein C8J57DRAFT_1516284 [Mycena rebaudengoi]